ncbi:hypothetical protein FQZ97_1113120 [compost metagenome]
MQFGLRRRQAIHGLRAGAGGEATLLLLVVPVGLVRHHADGRQAAVGGQLARGLVLSQQQAERAAGDRTLAEVGVEQAAAVGGFQQMVEEALDLHALRTGLEEGQQ